MIFDMPKCGGCRTCELACSYHHRSIFNPGISSIVIHDKLPGQGYEVELVDKDSGTRIPCDGCEKLEVPLCMEYCKEQDELGKMIIKLVENYSVSKSKE
jgi:Fe-S-cluster-containing dehydrogenase component